MGNDRRGHTWKLTPYSFPGSACSACWVWWMPFCKILPSPFQPKTTLHVKRSKGSIVLLSSWITLSVDRTTPTATRLECRFSRLVFRSEVPKLDSRVAHLKGQSTFSMISRGKVCRRLCYAYPIRNEESQNCLCCIETRCFLLF